jgi:Ca2+-binding RTX toxin-like protein
MRLFLLTLLCAVLLQGTAAVANTSHDGWPPINGIQVMNKNDSGRPLDARPGHDPFGGQDTDYSCDEVHLRGVCQRRFVGEDAGEADARHGRGGGCIDAGSCVVASQKGHNELLGGHGSDTIHAGPWGDVLWGDYKPSGQGTSQRDRLYGGAGRDFIYASHGWNLIKAGAGNDWIKAHFGRGTIDCGSGRDVLYVSHKALKRFKVRGCETISHKTLGY